MRQIFALLPLMASLSACADIPQGQPMRQQSSAITPRPGAQQCLGQLGRTNASFTPLPDRYFSAGCSTLNSVRLASLSGDDASLSLTNLGPVACPLANVFAGWARFGADRAAQQVLGSRLVRIETMGSYNCRTVAGSDRLSAHSRAEAIDVSAFVLADGRRISIAADWSEGTPAERRFLQVVHASACKRFGTVLGPAYNPAHHDHLHLEYSGRAFCK